MTMLYAANVDVGVHVDQIKQQVTQQGYTTGDIKMAINHLSNKLYIYSTVDERLPGMYGELWRRGL